jgi:hypothetical protein
LQKFLCKELSRKDQLKVLLIDQPENSKEPLEFDISPVKAGENEKLTLSTIVITRKQHLKSYFGI